MDPLIFDRKVSAGSGEWGRLKLVTGYKWNSTGQCIRTTSFYFWARMHVGRTAPLSAVIFYPVDKYKEGLYGHRSQIRRHIIGDANLVGNN